jgi:uncharacterized protein YfiM (DUF2279 family)
MITQMALVAALLLPQTRSGAALQDPWFSPDKAKHFMLAGFIESASFAAMETAGISRNSSLAGAVAITGALSLMREIHDKRAKNQFSFRDLTWDAAGALAAFVMLRHAERP